MEFFFKFSSIKLNLHCFLRRDVAQPGSAPRSGRGGRRFESGHPDKKKSPSARMDFFICGSREKARFRTDAANKKTGAQRLTFLFESPQIRINGVNPALTK